MHLARGDSEAVGPDQAGAVVPHQRDQLALGAGAIRARLGEAGRDHADRADACCERRGNRGVHRGGRHTDDRQVDGLGQVGHALHRRYACDRLARPVDRDGSAGESARDDVAEHRAADRPFTRRCPDHGHGPRPQEGLQRPVDGGVVAAVDRVLETVARRDPQVDVDLPAFVSLLDVESGVGEHAQHGLVARHHLRDECLDALRGCGLRQLLDQARTHSQPLKLGCDGKGRLGPGRVAQTGVACNRDHIVALLTPQQPDQRAPHAPVGVEHPTHGLGVYADNAVEAQVAAAVVQPAKKLHHGIGVGELRWSQPQGAAVAQDDVADAIRDRCFRRTQHPPHARCRGRSTHRRGPSTRVR